MSTSQFKTLAWGKGTLYSSALGSDGATTTWKKVPTPVNESTAINYTEGTELRAEIEGGELEGYKRGKGNFELVFRIRLAPESTIPFTDNDGQITGKYAFKYVPEDASAIGFSIPCSEGYVAPQFSSTDGLSKEYHFTALAPTNGGNKIEFAVQSAPSVSSDD